VLSCMCMVFAEKKPLAAETVMLQKKATMPRLMPANSQSPSPSPDVSEATPTPSPTPLARIRTKKETLLENTPSPTPSPGLRRKKETLLENTQPSGGPSGGPSALPTCSGDENSWNAGYGPCTSYAGMNHGYCSMDMSEGLYARDVCPQCGQCSSPVLAQIRHGLRRNKMRDQVWKQRNERDSKVVASEAKVKAASTKKQKTAEPIAKQKVTAASGEAVMFQAAQTMSRSSNELRL